MAIKIDLHTLRDLIQSKEETPGESVPIGEELGKLLKDSLEKLYQNYAKKILKNL